MSVFALSGEVCLVTGASRGIGQAIAVALGKHGAVVIGTATSSAGAQRISECLDDEQIQGFGTRLDVNDLEAVNAVVKHVQQEVGAPTVLVNNAGITRDNLLLRMSESEWDEVMETNLKSIYRVTKACLRGMTKARRGRVINITSVVAASGNPGQCNYAAAKAGMIGFTRSLAQEVATRGITVNAVAPGFIDTDMTRTLDESQRDALLQYIPLGRLGSPDDVANAVVFLASPAAGYITGATLHINGGMYMGG